MAPKANLADFLAALLDTIFVLTGGLLILTGLAGGVDGGVGRRKQSDTTQSRSKDTA